MTTCGSEVDTMSVTVDPFWKLVQDSHDRVLLHPETELTVEFGDRRATLWAKRDSETGQLKVQIETEYIVKSHTNEVGE